MKSKCRAIAITVLFLGLVLVTGSKISPLATATVAAQVQRPTDPVTLHLAPGDSRAAAPFNKDAQQAAQAITTNLISTATVSGIGSPP